MNEYQEAIKRIISYVENYKVCAGFFFEIGEKIFEDIDVLKN